MIQTLAMAGMATLNMAGAGRDMRKQNRQLADQAKEVKRKFLIKKGISEQQLDEIGEVLFKQMTNTTRSFLKAKSRLKVAQAESGVAGKSVDRLFLNADLKEAEAKSGLIETSEKSAINIANRSLGDYVEANSNLTRIKAQTISGSEALMRGLMAGLQGAQQGAQLSSAMGNMSFSTAPSGGFKGFDSEVSALQAGHTGGL